MLPLLPAGTRSLGADAAEAIRYGEYDETGWSSLSTLELPADHRVAPMRGSSLVRFGDTLAFATHARDTVLSSSTAAVWTRHDGTWTREDLRLTTTSAVDLAILPTGRPLLLVVRARSDSVHRGDVNSLFFFARSDGWKPVRRVVFGGIEGPVHWPQMSIGDPNVLTWWTDGSTAGAFEVRAMIGVTEGENGSTVVVDSAVSWSHVAVRTRGVLWIINHLKDLQSLAFETRFVTLDGAGRTTRIASWPSPFEHGTLNALALGPDEILLSGPTGDRSTGVLSSLLIRARLECPLTPRM